MLSLSVREEIIDYLTDISFKELVENSDCIREEYELERITSEEVYDLVEEYRDILIKLERDRDDNK